ncbi:terpene synthase family protein [Streptomyces sp. 4.24]|uniref:terpene synthase family protein n=1 Tax=Streptomyces tritrimontium TaxID=3406573 RepID=UPI003BB6AD82
MAVVNASILIPGFYEPPSHLINPHTEQAGAETIEWLRRMGIIETEADENRVRGFQLNYWAGLTVNDAPPERFLPYCKFAFYFTLLDDHLETMDSMEAVRRFRRQVVDILGARTAELPGGQASPWLRAFADLWPQITDHLSEQATQRFIRYYLDSVDCTGLEILHRLNGTTPTLAQYLPLRFNTVAMNYTPLAGQNAMRLELPDELAEHYLMAEALRCGTDLVGWANDLESYQEEMKQGHTCNLIAVIAASEECSIEDAADRTHKWIRQRQKDLLDIEEALPSLVTDLALPPEAAMAASGFLTFIKSAFWAFVMFCEVSGRYQEVSENSGVAASVEALRGNLR